MGFQVFTIGGPRKYLNSIKQYSLTLTITIFEIMHI
jgi:hypothetical protein